MERSRVGFDRSITELEAALALDAKHAEIRDELALAIEARGWIYRELGALALAEKNYRRALDLLEKLVSDFPTVPRHREWLAKVCNSLGILGKRPADSTKPRPNCAGRSPWSNGFRKTFLTSLSIAVSWPEL